MEKVIKRYLSKIGKVGGNKKSEIKTDSCKANLIKAREAKATSRKDGKIRKGEKQ